MPELTLYHAVPSRSAIARWMLEEVGEPYGVHLLDLKKGENRQPAYLAVNPMGKVPALRHGDAVITEAAAVCWWMESRYRENPPDKRGSARKDRRALPCEARRALRPCGEGRVHRAAAARRLRS